MVKWREKTILAIFDLFWSLIGRLRFRNKGVIYCFLETVGLEVFSDLVFQESLKDQRRPYSRLLTIMFSVTPCLYLQLHLDLDKKMSPLSFSLFYWLLEQIHLPKV